MITSFILGYIRSTPVLLLMGISIATQYAMQSIASELDPHPPSERNFNRPIWFRATPAAFSPLFVAASGAGNMGAVYFHPLIIIIVAEIPSITSSMNHFHRRLSVICDFSGIHPNISL